MKSDLFTSSLRPVDFRDGKEKSFTGRGGEAEPRILKDGSTTGDLFYFKARKFREPVRPSFLFRRWPTRASVGDVCAVAKREARARRIWRVVVLIVGTS